MEQENPPPKPESTPPALEPETPEGAAADSPNAESPSPESTAPSEAAPEAANAEPVSTAAASTAAASTAAASTVAATPSEPTASSPSPEATPEPDPTPPPPLESPAAIREPVLESGPSPVEKNWAVGAHLASVAGWLGVPFGHILAPLAIWLIKKEESEFVRSQAIESLNFQISMTIYAFIAGIIASTIIGLIVAIPALGLLLVVDVVYTIIGALRVSEGIAYRYPCTIRLLS